MWGKKNGKQFTHTFNCHHHRRAAMTRPAEARKRFERKSNNKTVHPNTAAVKRQGRKKKAQEGYARAGVFWWNGFATHKEFPVLHPSSSGDAVIDIIIINIIIAVVVVVVGGNLARR